MPSKPPNARSKVAIVTRRRVERASDQRRGSASSRGYSAAWQRASKSHLRRSPLCLYCETGAFDGRPRVTAATLVDHLYPHRGDQALFWTTRLWVSACATCHDGPKQACERRGQAALDELAGRLGLDPPA